MNGIATIPSGKKDYYTVKEFNITYPEPKLVKIRPLNPGILSVALTIPVYIFLITTLIKFKVGVGGNDG